jgi:hypothetical protein
VSFPLPGGHRLSHLLDVVQAGRFPIYRETNIETYTSKAKGWAEDERKRSTQYISSLKEAEMLLYISKVLQIHKSNKTETLLDRFIFRFSPCIFKVNHFYWPTNALNCIKFKG